MRDADETCLDAVLELIQQTASEHKLPHRFAAKDRLVDAGMTSLAMVDLMFAVEARFNVMIPDRELTPANFQSGESIAATVARVLPLTMSAHPC